MALYCLGKLDTAYSISAVLIAEAKLVANEGERYRVLTLACVLPAWLEERVRGGVISTVMEVWKGSSPPLVSNRS